MTPEPRVRTLGSRTSHPRRLVAAVVALLAVVCVPAVMAVRQGSREGRSPIRPPAGSPPVRAVDVRLGRAGVPTWSSWPQALHDARHSGSSALTGPRRGSVVWRRHLGAGPDPSGPVTGADGTIFVVDDRGRLHAVDPADGSDRWVRETGSPVTGDLSTSPLVLPDGDVVAASAYGLTAWSPDGLERWQVRLPAGATSPATTDGRRIYVGTTGGHLVALDVRRHRAVRRWTLDLRTGQSYGSVVTDGHGRIYQTSGTGLVAVDDAGESARVAWTRDPQDGLVEVSPGLGPDGTVLLGTNGTREWAYDHDGRLAWSAPRRITYSSPSVTADGLAYVGEHVDRVHVFDVRTGREVGLFPTTVVKVRGRTRVWTSVVVDAEHVAYFATRTHYVVAVRPDGRRLFTTDLGASTSSYPALTGDHALVLATDDGALVKIR